MPKGLDKRWTGSIQEVALDELEEVYHELAKKGPEGVTIPELGRLGRIAAVLRRAKRIA